jgi:serine/threonine protein kinase
MPPVKPINFIVYLFFKYVDEQNDGAYTVSVKPEFFGKYILLDKLAMGGMAEVYRAKAPGAEGIGKIIAIKRILPQYSANHEFIEMFKSEAKIAINLAQGNIAQIYEFGEEKDQFFIAMEYIEGRNLRQMLTRCTKQQKSLSIEQCVYVIAQVANGLDHAHRCTNKNTGQTINLIHRDMSPQNIMVSFEGEVKIIDFGIAKAESKIETTRAGILKGKFGYMSPEQAEGSDLDARTDIFSTGIVLWELLSGERLFVANNEVNTIRKIRECQIPPLRKVNPNVHEELERITAKALAKDRSLRYQTASELYRDLSRFLYKVNPEFTPHELCIFVKSLFKDDIIEDRKQVLEFSKINFPTRDKKVEKIIEVNTFSNTVTEASGVSQQSTTIPESLPGEIDVPKNLIFENSADQKELSFDFKADSRDLLRQVQSRHNAQTPRLNSPSRTMSSATMGSIRAGTASNYRSVKKAGIAVYLPRVIVVVSLGIFGSVAYRNADQILASGNKFLGHIQGQIELQSRAPYTKPVESPAEPSTSRVFIRSIPAGADILVNGAVKGTTPAEIIIPLQKKVVIALNHDGYFPYSKEFIATKDLEDFAATLQKAMTGYLDIEVSPSTADIFVNGQKLVEKSPVARYPVPAGVPIRIRAVNPFSNTTDETVVTVKQDTVRPIKLFPRKTK